MREHFVTSGAFFFLLNHLIHSYAGNFPTPHPRNDKITNYEHSHSGVHQVSQDSTHSAPKLRKLAFGRVDTIATTVTVLITLLSIIVFVYTLQKIHESNLMEPYKPSEQSCRKFSLADIKLATKNFDASSVIGDGGFGIVYRGVIDEGKIHVAVKRRLSNSKQGANEFRAEIKNLSSIRHCNIVSLIGYCDDHEEMILIYEYMIHGTLADHIHENSIERSDLSWTQSVKICIGVAQGLNYIHTGIGDLTKVIHRDIKSTNILLGENWTPKISDFGISKLGPSNQLHTYVSTTVIGSNGYIDPEYASSHQLTSKSDVYAFGVILLEVLSGRPAVELSPDGNVLFLAKWAPQCIRDGKQHEIINPKLAEQISSDSFKAFVGIVDQCVQHQSNKRPTMVKVLAALEHALTVGEQTYFSINEESKMVQQFNIGTRPVISDMVARDASSSSLRDGGKLSFTLDKRSGKKCCMVPARDLKIEWGDKDKNWKWPTIPESRFTEVAELREVYWLDIRCKIETRMLSPATKYVAYMLYKVSQDDHDRIGPVKTSVRFVGHKAELDTSVVYLKEPIPRGSVSRFPQRRMDSWMEIELGEFFIDRGDEGKVKIRLEQTDDKLRKSGLTVEGIEVRPK